MKSGWMLSTPIRARVRYTSEKGLFQLVKNPCGRCTMSLVFGELRRWSRLCPNRNLHRGARRLRRNLLRFIRWAPTHRALTSRVARVTSPNMTNKASVDADIAAALAETERAGLKLVLTIRNGLVFFAAILIIATQGVERGVFGAAIASIFLLVGLAFQAVVATSNDRT